MANVRCWKFWSRRLLSKNSSKCAGSKRARRRARLGRFEKLEDRTLLSLIYVTDAGDASAVDGKVTLREAIESMNGHANVNSDVHGIGVYGIADLIYFSIPGTGLHTITVDSPLPDVTVPVTIDGYTQPGSIPNTSIVGDNAVLKIELTASPNVYYSARGLTLSGGNTTVRGLAITGFYDSGIAMHTKGNNVIEGNFIGMHADGKTIGSNGTGINPNSNYVYDPAQFTYVLTPVSTGNRIGGLALTSRNIISGNNYTDVSLSSQNTLQGNYIGPDATGKATTRINSYGVYVTGDGNSIGGPILFGGNIISGHSTGIYLAGKDNTVQGNYVGVDANGTAPLGNNTGGIQVAGDNALIGGTQFGAGNVISANGGPGVTIYVNHATVQGNRIGTDVTGTADLGNAGEGVSIQYGSANNLIGGTTTGAGNTIAFNTGGGVLVATTGTGNAILGNSIFSNKIGAIGNSGRGIDLASDNYAYRGVTPPDYAGHSGPNNFQNFPILTQATGVPGLITITGSLNSTPSTTFRVEFFSSTAAQTDPTGFGAGKTFLGFANVTTDANGAATFSKTIGAVVVTGDFISATATDADNNTSEFSQDVVMNGGAILSVNDSLDSEPPIGTADATFTVTLTNGPANKNVTVNVSVMPGTALAGVNITPPPETTLTFAPGETSKTVTVPLLNDSDNDGNLFYYVNLTGATNATILKRQGQGTIVNHLSPNLYVTTYPGLQEPASGTSTQDVKLTLSAPTDIPASVTVSTMDGTAIAGTNYVALPPTTVTFAPGETEKTIPITIIADPARNDYFNYFNFSLRFENLVGLTRYYYNSDSITIYDYRNKLGFVGQPEPYSNYTMLFTANTSDGVAVLPVALSEPSRSHFTVDFYTDDYAYGDRARPNVDYLPTRTTLEFDVGDISKTITVPLLQHTTPEPDRILHAYLSNIQPQPDLPIIEGIGFGGATITIHDDSIPLFVDDPHVTKQSSGAVDAVFTVTLSQPVAESVSVDVSTADGTAIAGVDYVALPTTTVTFDPGETSKQVSVSVLGNTSVTGDLTFLLNLGNVITTNTQVRLALDEGVGHILDPQAVRVLRLYNPPPYYDGHPYPGPGQDLHVFTTDPNEYRTRLQEGWTDETAGRASFLLLRQQREGTVPVHRLYNPQYYDYTKPLPADIFAGLYYNVSEGSQHYLTTSDAERDQLVSLGWNDEGNEGFIYTTQVPGTVPIFDLMNRRNGDHLYTDQPGVRNAVTAIGPAFFENLLNPWFERAILGYSYPVTSTISVPGHSAAAQAEVFYATTPEGTPAAATSQRVLPAIADDNAPARVIEITSVTSQTSDVDSSPISQLTDDEQDDYWTQLATSLAQGPDNLESDW